MPLSAPRRAAADPLTERKVAQAVLLPLRRRILFALEGDGRSAAQLARELDESRSKLSYHLDVLRDARLVRRGASRKRRGFSEHPYAKTPLGVEVEARLRAGGGGPDASAQAPANLSDPPTHAGRMTTPEETLAKLGYALPEAPKPVAAYVPSVRSGNLVYVSGQVSFVNGKLEKTGIVPREVTIEEAQGFARICALNAIAVLKAEIGELSRVKRIVRVGAFVASEDGFTAQPQVANGASELLLQVFGEAGRHARAAVGVNALPLGAPVEVELIAEVE